MTNDMTSDELEHFAERAAIREFDGELPREEAERLAREDVMRGRPWARDEKIYKLTGE